MPAALVDDKDGSHHTVHFAVVVVVAVGEAAAAAVAGVGEGCQKGRG